MREGELREQICEIGRLLHRKEYVAATDGNISVRLPGNRVLATPSGAGKGFMKPDELVVVDLRGKQLSGTLRPTTELGMHLLFYRLRPDVNAVVHAHPPTATAYAAAGRALDQALVSEIVMSLGCVPLAPFGTPGTPELAESMKHLAPAYDAILLANHGVVTCGPDLLRAYFNMETVEQFARISFVSELLGSQVVLGRAEVEKLLAARDRYLGLDSPSPLRPRCPLTCEDLEKKKAS